ncbi:MAG: hypothetical protein Q9201_006446 [Fulgogasparrea decipioides]
MATQAMLIAETIAGMKRATARHNRSSPSSDSEDSIDRSTNRGNKLKRKARYVHEGQLDRPNGPRVYKRRIEHAGFHREVISQNPKRYDDNGDALEDDEEDEEADAAAAEANPYNGVILHQLLAPLISAADLPIHPSLSVPYLSPILGNMTQKACEMLQRERNTIRGAKQLLIKLRGDDTWVPCGSLDSDMDDVIFDTNRVYDEIVRPRPTSRTASKDNRRVAHNTDLAHLQDGSMSIPRANQIMDEDAESQQGAPLSLRQQDRRETFENISESLPALNALNGRETLQEQTEEIRMAIRDHQHEPTATQDLEGHRKLDGAHFSLSEVQEKEGSGAGAEISEEIDDKQNNTSEGKAILNTVPEDAVRTRADEETSTSQQMAIETPYLENSPATQAHQARTDVDGAPLDTKEHVVMEVEESQAANDDVQPVAHRMRTRAQAQAVPENAISSQARSASNASSVLPSIHPLFLIPSEACPDRDFGLPPGEAEATRRILMSYVQKQEEVCRGAEKLYNGLLKAERMKKHIFESCKAEGHVGEMSDGEDWYDKEEWSLEEDLRKGKDEEQEDEAGTQHKKTRGRRA